MEKPVRNRWGFVGNMYILSIPLGLCFYDFSFMDLRGVLLFYFDDKKPRRDGGGKSGGIPYFLVLKNGWECGRNVISRLP